MIVCPQQFYDAELAALDLSCDILLADPSLTQDITGFRLHGGVMALASRPPDHGLETFGSQVIALDGCNNSENIGAVLRNCLAFGYDSVLIGPTACSPWLRRAIRVAMGSTFKLKLRHSTDLGADLRELQTAHYRILAAELTPTSQAIGRYGASNNAAAHVLILGHESLGVSNSLAPLVDASVHIPMQPGIDSLNVAVASGILMHQLSSIAP